MKEREEGEGGGGGGGGGGEVKKRKKRRIVADDEDQNSDSSSTGVRPDKRKKVAMQPLLSQFYARMLHSVQSSRPMQIPTLPTSSAPQPPHHPHAGLLHRQGVDDLTGHSDLL